MGSDDEFYGNDVLNNISNELKDFDLVYGNVFFKHKKIVYDGKYGKRRIIDRSICHQAAIFSKRVFNMVGAYNKKLKLAGDWDLFLRCYFNKNIKIKYIENIICLYDETGISGHKHENRYTKYKILYNRLGIWGICKYLMIQVSKKVGGNS
jgi:hypothetical protein